MLASLLLYGLDAGTLERPECFRYVAPLIPIASSEAVEGVGRHAGGRPVSRDDSGRGAKSVKGWELQELRVALGYSLEELSRILKQSRIAPLIRGKSRQSLHRLEKLANEDVEPPELVEWMLALRPLPEARQDYEKYLARKAARAAEASIPAPAPVPDTATPEPLPAPVVPPPPAIAPTAVVVPPPVQGGVPGSSATADPPPSLRGLMAIVALLTASVFLLFLTQLVHVLGGSTHPEWGFAGGNLGEKRSRLVVPKAPLRGQKTTPCDENAGQVPINGGCWYGGRAGPCSATKEFEHASRCYLPVAEDPAIPVSMDSLDGGVADPPP